MINYIGDISKKDAEVLAIEAAFAEDILEFGVGASTQVLAKYSYAKMLSIDTEPVWIEKTKQNIEYLEIKPKDLQFMDYNAFMNKPYGMYDFIFNDGGDGERRNFALKVWPNLKVGNCMAFHDTRRAHDFRNVLEVIAHYQDEISNVHFNYQGSNITLVYKRTPQPYVNWQIEEKREQWQLGYGDPPKK